MIDDDDDDSFLLFDEADELPADFVPSNCLVVGPPPPKPEMLNELEARYRREGLPPVMFIDDDDVGNPVFGNPATFAKAMGLAPDALVTMDQANDWIARGIAAGRWASWDW
jgi:hypothetical protein